MSYIRSGSNPEKLYIVGTGKNVEIMEGNKDVWYIPPIVFNGLIKRYNRTSHEFPCSYKGAKVEEVWVDHNNREETDTTFNPISGHSLDCKVKLTYEDHCVYMWLVTWEHIVS
jgi:hypothetical protein